MAVPKKNKDELSLVKVIKADDMVEAILEWLQSEDVVVKDGNGNEILDAVIDGDNADKYFTDRFFYIRLLDHVEVTQDIEYENG